MLHIPKIKGIKIKLHRAFQGKIKTVTLSKTAYETYYASILVENDVQYPPLAPVMPAHTLGIDLGLNHFAITSQGEKKAHPKFFKKALKRLGLEKIIKKDHPTIKSSV